MTYATQSDIETRYPGELEQAGPRDTNQALDNNAIEQALIAADGLIDQALRAIGWSVPLAAPAPDWVIALAVDIALYKATPTALASQPDFADRKARHDQALKQLALIAAGNVQPPLPAGQADPAAPVPTPVYHRSKARQFGRGTL